MIVGNYLTTIGRDADDDHALLEALGMPVAEGPGEGRFVVDATGAHARPAQPPRNVRHRRPPTRRFGETVRSGDRQVGGFVEGQQDGAPSGRDADA